ncbi:MAG TPA: hypothetical protein VI792_04050 [Candidatus Eisenbacteria bacterium]
MRGHAVLAALVAAGLSGAAAPVARGAAAFVLPDSARYALAFADVNRLGLAVTNYGFLGTNFSNKSPSFEFPLGSGYEHMSRAGLWVGARALADTGEFTGVSTAIVDNAQGTDQTSETEFTPTGRGLAQHSRIPNSDQYSPNAVSDQDLDCWYADVPARTTQSEPLNILVHQRTLGFTLGVADAFVVVRFTIINRGSPLKDLYAGLYAQLVSGNKNSYPSFPPSGWYYKAHIDYDAGRRLYKEHYCTTAPYPTGCNFPVCPPWASAKLLKVSSAPLDSETVSFNWWSYSPGDPARATDDLRYAIMTNGLTLDPSGCLPGGDCSPIMVLSVGPLGRRAGIHRELDNGDSVTVDFAFVGGEDESKLLEHADYAQFAADIDYKLPSPPPSPRLFVESHGNRLDVYWDDSPESTVDSTSTAPGYHDFEGYRVYLGEDRNQLRRIAQFDIPDTSGFNTGFGAIRLPSPRIVNGRSYPYRYSLTSLRDGFSYFGAVTSFDIGDITTPSLESGISQNKFLAVPMPAAGESPAGVTVFPNPYRVEARWDQGRLVRDHYLWFANLPRRALIRIYTLSGDLVQEVHFDGASYRGEGARGLYDPAHGLDTPPPALSGASYAWDMVSREGQAVATGLYLYSVEDLATGNVSRGKFLLVKSDRER